MLVRTKQSILYGLVFICLVLFPSGIMAAQADTSKTLMWARENKYFGGLTAVYRVQNGNLYCVGCNFNNYGPIEIQRDIGVDADVLSNLEVWESTLWVILFRLDVGHQCSGNDWYSMSLNTHPLKHIDTTSLGCTQQTISVTDEGLGMVLTISNKQGKKEITHIQ